MNSFGIAKNDCKVWPKIHAGDVRFVFFAQFGQMHERCIAKERSVSKIRQSCKNTGLISARPKAEYFLSRVTGPRICPSVRVSR